MPVSNIILINLGKSEGQENDARKGVNFHFDSPTWVLQLHILHFDLYLPSILS